ncbi:hypothetical protein BV22DRAFT_1036108 [Leucogyrophana mollusca]|uniref:Uncharacterized protein n=1 Tax=Leucogyrophana mollusca TaxID=85980 RepID=A0ACB8BEG0_9AGAM|nr:hypothetical protein BV22DRAFT_1036108 [Leucogyrophana mollusca]
MAFPTTTAGPSTLVSEAAPRAFRPIPRGRRVLPSEGSHPASMTMPGGTLSSRDSPRPSNTSDTASASDSASTSTRIMVGPPDFFYGKMDEEAYMDEMRPVPFSWVKHVHFSGKVYFYCKLLRLVTPNDIREELILKEVTRLRTEQIAGLGKVSYNLALYCEHVITLPPLDSTAPPDIYHVYTRERRVLRLNGNEVEKQPKSMFWGHYETYPMHCNSLPWDFEVDFLNAITFGANERICDFRNTHFPFGDRQCERFLRIYQDLKDRQESTRDGVVPAMIWHIARVMAEVEKSRLLYKWGTHGNRIYRNIAIPEPTWLELLLALPLFGAHSMYRKRLQSTRVKGAVYVPDFQKLMQQFLGEWADSNLLATVFVSANVAFLAVPNINALQRTASLASSLFAMMSIAVGVHHVWRHRSKVDAEYKDADSYLHHVQKLGEQIDLTVTACFLSLPIVALLWSVLSFTIAIAAFCIQDTDVHGEILLIVVLSILGFCAFVTLLFFWHIWKSPRLNEIEEDFHLNTASNKPLPLSRTEKVEKLVQGVQGWLRSIKVARRNRGDTTANESSNDKGSSPAT